MTYGYLCAGCYQDWLENMREADEYRKKKGAEPGTVLYQTPDYAKIRSGEQSWVSGSGFRKAIRSINSSTHPYSTKKEMVG
jgi:hypothetical protein